MLTYLPKMDPWYQRYEIYQSDEYIRITLTRVIDIGLKWFSEIWLELYRGNGIWANVSWLLHRIAAHLSISDDVLDSHDMVWYLYFPDILMLGVLDFRSKNLQIVKGLSQISFLVSPYPHPGVV